MLKQRSVMILQICSLYPEATSSVLISQLCSWKRDNDQAVWNRARDFPWRPSVRHHAPAAIVLQHQHSLRPWHCADRSTPSSSCFHASRNRLFDIVDIKLETRTWRLTSACGLTLPQIWRALSAAWWHSIKKKWQALPWIFLDLSGVSVCVHLRVVAVVAVCWIWCWLSRSAIPGKWSRWNLAGNTRAQMSIDLPSEP